MPSSCRVRFWSELKGALNKNNRVSVDARGEENNEEATISRGGGFILYRRSDAILLSLILCGTVDTIANCIRGSQSGPAQRKWILSPLDMDMLDIAEPSDF